MPSKIRVAFLVDGKCERALVSKLDRTRHEFTFIKRDKNGRDVSPLAIARECGAILKMASRLNTVLIVIVDKEERPDMSAVQFESKLKDLISEEFNGKFDIVVTDLMFENWILSDIENVSLAFPNEIKATKNSTSFESTHGSGQLDSLWITSGGKSKYSSDKITNSKKLFKYVQPNIGSQFSSSFQRLLLILDKHLIKMH